MNRRLVLRVSGSLLFVVAFFLLLPAAIGLLDDDRRAIVAYASSAAAAALFGALLRMFGGDVRDVDLHRKDAFGVVALIWILLGFFGALPLMIDGAIDDPYGAIFEAVSGFTTTGATVVADVDGLSRATNFWRCLMHWIGGMGIVVLFVAIFPQIGVGAKQLFKTEVPGPTSEGLRPRIKQTATTLWWVYSGLTAVCAGLLWWLGMSWYDAVAHAFSTLGTGGFSTKTASIGHYDSEAIEWTIAIFMLIAGTNFGLYYGAARGKWRALFRNTELRFYLLANLIIVMIVAVAIVSRHDSLHGAVRAAAFQTLAVTTTTGFMTEDFDAYPDVARFLLFGAMFMGGCAGSTAGGIKAVRILVLIRVVFAEIRTAVRPNVVQTIRLAATVVPPQVVSAVLVFVVAYLALFVTVSWFMVLLGLDLLTGMSATIACLSSIGPGLAGVGPSQNFAHVPGVGKLALSFCMIAGRLEIFALFAVFSPECWRR